MEDKILYIKYGGLGDNLQYSTLPELFVKNGYDVYISNQSEFRNDEIKKLVWDYNPYIKGYSDKTPNCGAVMEYRNDFNYSIIENWEIIHGFKPINKYPIIYYQPKFDERFINKVFIDLGYTSTYYDDKRIYEEFNKLNEDFIEINFNYPVSKKKINLKNFENTIVINSIFEYCDLIFNCKKIYTTFSGASVLASAIIRYGEKKCWVFINTHYYNQKNYVFENLNYIIC